MTRRERIAGDMHSFIRESGANRGQESEVQGKRVTPRCRIPDVCAFLDFVPVAGRFAPRGSVLERRLPRRHSAALDVQTKRQLEFTRDRRVLGAHVGPLIRIVLQII